MTSWKEGIIALIQSNIMPASLMHCCTGVDRLQKRGSYIRTMPRCEDEREEQRKAARLSLDTSAHASLEYHKILQQCSSSPVYLPPNLTSSTLQHSTRGSLLGVQI